MTNNDDEKIVRLTKTEFNQQVGDAFDAGVEATLAAIEIVLRGLRGHVLAEFNTEDEQGDDTLTKPWKEIFDE